MKAINVSDTKYRSLPSRLFSRPTVPTHCRRCRGLLVPDWALDEREHTVMTMRRCVQCGARCEFGPITY